MYLSEEEKNVKEKIDESLREFFPLHDQLTLRTKSKLTFGMLQSFSRDSLQNRQTSPRTQREKIDEISLQMNDQVKAFERQYSDDK
jgi:hypothetical protein